MKIAWRKLPVGTPNLCLGIAFLATYLDHGITGTGALAAINIGLAISFQLFFEGDDL